MLASSCHSHDVMIVADVKDFSSMHSDILLCTSSSQQSSSLSMGFVGQHSRKIVFAQLPHRHTQQFLGDDCNTPDHAAFAC